MTYAAWEKEQRLSPYVVIHTTLGLNGQVVAAWTNYGDNWGDA